MSQAPLARSPLDREQPPKPGDKARRTGLLTAEEALHDGQTEPNPRRVLPGEPGMNRRLVHVRTSERRPAHVRAATPMIHMWVRNVLTESAWWSETVSR